MVMVERDKYSEDEVKGEYFDKTWDPMLAVENGEGKFLPMEYIGIPFHPFVNSYSSGRANMEFQTQNKKQTPVDVELNYVNDGVDILNLRGVIAPLITKECVFYKQYRINDKMIYVMVESDGKLASYVYNEYIPSNFTAKFEFMYPKKGDKFKEGDILAKPQSWIKTPCGWRYGGMLARVALRSDPNITDDGILISKSFSQKFRYTTREVIDVNISKDTIGVLIHDDGKGGKTFLPRVGQVLRGVVCVLKNINTIVTERDLTNYLTCDDIHTYRTSNVVKSITVTKNKENGRVLDYMENELEKLIMDSTNVYEELVDDFGNFDEWTSQSHVMYDNALAHITPQAKIKGTNNKTIYTVSVELVGIHNLHRGCKITNNHSAKTMVTAVIDDDEMAKIATDGNGLVADIVIESSEVNRMNLSFTHDRYITTVAYFMHCDIVEAYENGELTVDGVGPIWDKYMRLLDIFRNQQFYNFSEVEDAEEKIEILRYIVDYREVIVLRADSYKPAGAIVRDLVSSEFKLCEDGWLNDDGILEGSGYNGILPVHLLNKVSDRFNSCGTQYTNGFTATSIMGNSLPFSPKPSRTESETSVRIDSRIMNEEHVKEKRLSHSVQANRYLARHFLEHGKMPDKVPSDIKDVIHDQFENLMNSYGANLCLVNKETSEFNAKKLLQESFDEDYETVIANIKNELLEGK